MLRRLTRRLLGAATPAALDGAPRSVEDLLGPARPLNLEVRGGLEPQLNVLVPGLGMRSMSGGPSTALNIACRMAAQGVPVRLVSTDLPTDRDPEPLWRHMMQLAGLRAPLANVRVLSANDRSRPFPIGVNDVFLATAWWTAQMAKHALPRMACRRFLYLIQDFEPGLHAHSTLHALAQETYGLDYYAIVNHPLLHTYLTGQRVGRFADPGFAARSVVLDPAIDRSHFFPAERPANGERTLLFYARPDSAQRNLFELGAAALRLAAERGVFDGARWGIHGIGDHFQPVALGARHTLRALPWMSYDDYAARMRSADILLSLMLSPHPSYPPLEMAATGGVAVTNTFATKTAARLAELSPNILAAEPSVESIAAAIGEAVASVPQRRDATLKAPSSWEESFAPVLPFAMRAWRECTRSG
jgi:hypothetical protein